MDKANIALGTGLVAIVIAIVSIFSVHSLGGQVAGSTTPGTRFVHGLTIGNPAVLGTNPTNLSKLLMGTCSLISGAYNIAASSTVAMDCAITGVVSTDGVFAQFATSTNAVQGWSVAGASASSTAGYITLSVVNGTGAAAIIPASVASSTKYIILGSQ